MLRSHPGSSRLARAGRRLALLAAAASLAVPATLGGCVGPEPPRPNLVLISLDTLRPDHLGVYGYERDTSPHLDRLATGGVVFEKAYAHGPNTAPTHHSVLTSLYPSVHGIDRHGLVLDPDVPMLPEILRDAGYATGGFVQLPGTSYRRGFDHYTGLSHAASLRKAKRFGAGLESIGEWIAGLEEGVPFFLFVHTYAVHLPYAPRPENLERFDPGYDGVVSNRVKPEEIDRINRGELPVDDEDLEHLVALYDAEIAGLDADLGTLFESFEAMGLLDETVFVLMADHGEELGEHGVWGQHSHTLYEELIRIPLIVLGPGVPAGRRIDRPARQVDIAPTLLDFAGIEPPEHFRGTSLRPVWEGTEAGERIVMAELPGLRAIIDGDLKYFTNGRLYDLAADPGEQHDIAHERPEALQRMRRLAEAWDDELVRERRRISRPGDVELSEEERRRLRALGYLN
ncbi:MAG: sulfatase [Acidobacteriota bacterium]|jgi:arylsulfatase A-like enzyme